MIPEQQAELQISIREGDFANAEKVCQTGKVGIYAPGALGVALGFSLQTDSFILRSASQSSPYLSGERQVYVRRPSGAVETIPGIFSRGIVDAYQNKTLPEVIIATSHTDNVDGLLDELFELTHTLVSDGIIYIDQAGKIQGLENLPAVVIASNGILDDRIRNQIRERYAIAITGPEKGEAISQAWSDHIIRGLAFVSASRIGSGDQTEYASTESGVVILAGGSENIRERTAELTDREGGIRFKVGVETPTEYEWRKAYTNLMTNVVALLVSYDQRKKRAQLNLPVGRLISRMKPAKEIQYVEAENAHRWCERLGKAFFAIAKGKGLFSNYSSWEAFNEVVFLDPIRDVDTFYQHIPSSLQVVANRLRDNQLESGVPASEKAIIDPLLTEAKWLRDTGDGEIRRAIATLTKAQLAIADNINRIKELYEIPQPDSRSDRFSRQFDQSGEISFIRFNYKEAGLTTEDTHRYEAKSDVSSGSGDECVVPMTAEVFTYGPERFDGNIAFITNGAGFTLDFLDRAIKVGIRPGFISDLRVDFSEGKYYLAMKLALHANPNIDTIVVKALTTLGTTADIARAIERIAAVAPHLRFVLKVEGREQAEGIGYLQNLKQQGIPIFFRDENGSGSNAQTSDYLIETILQLDNATADKDYVDTYEPYSEEKLTSIVTGAISKRYLNILSSGRHSSPDLPWLETVADLTPDLVFGREFVPTVEGEILKGKPVVVIAGYGKTARIQAQLMKQAGTEVVLLHPRLTTKVPEVDLQRLAGEGIGIYTSRSDLKKSIEASYQGKPDIVGICYEPFKSEVDELGSYKERVENAVNSLTDLKTTHGLPVRSILIPTEMVPTSTAKELLSKCRDTGIWLIGPNSPGMTRTFNHTSTQEKIAQIPQHCVINGSTSVVGVGGTVLFETLKTLKDSGIGVSWTISLGGDMTRGLNARDTALMAERDPNTRYFVYIGEPGGVGAQELTELLKTRLITKPVIVRIIGRKLPDNCYIGHAGTVTQGRRYEHAEEKMRVLSEAGAIVVDTPEQMAQVIRFLNDYPRFQQIEIDSEAFESAEVAWKAVQTIIDNITAL